MVVNILVVSLVIIFGVYTDITIIEITVYAIRNVPGLGEKFCNGPGSVFVCSPYHFFSFWYCKLYLNIFINTYFFNLNRNICTIIIFAFGIKIS